MGTPTAPPAISQLLYLLDEAFDATSNEQSFLGNLRALVPEDWLWVPAGGRRSIRDIVRHVGGCKFMYHDYAFGDATLTWEDPLVDGGDALASSGSPPSRGCGQARSDCARVLPPSTTTPSCSARG
jgi:hypothetical protein